MNKTLLLKSIIFAIFIIIVSICFSTYKNQQNFNNEVKCQSMLVDLVKTYNTVVGIYYNKEQNTCVVRYKTIGKPINEKAMRDVGLENKI